MKVRQSFKVSGSVWVLQDGENVVYCKKHLHNICPEWEKEGSMTTIKTYCDHCGKELDDTKDYSDTEIGILDYCKADFCSKCLNELQDIIDEFIKI